jgi:hypothetical protein
MSLHFANINFQTKSFILYRKSTSNNQLPTNKQMTVTTQNFFSILASLIKILIMTNYICTAINFINPFFLY